MNKCKKCGNVIVDWVDSEGKHWHPFFVGYCPDCDVPCLLVRLRNVLVRFKNDKMP